MWGAKDKLHIENEYQPIYKTADTRAPLVSLIAKVVPPLFHFNIFNLIDIHLSGLNLLLSVLCKYCGNYLFIALYAGGRNMMWGKLFGILISVTSM